MLELTELIYAKNPTPKPHLAQCLSHSGHSINNYWYYPTANTVQHYDLNNQLTSSWVQSLCVVPKISELDLILLQVVVI